MKKIIVTILLVAMTGNRGRTSELARVELVFSDVK